MGDPRAGRGQHEGRRAGVGEQVEDLGARAVGESLAKPRPRENVLRE